MGNIFLEERVAGVASDEIIQEMVEKGHISSIDGKPILLYNEKGLPALLQSSSLDGTASSQAFTCEKGYRPPLDKTIEEDLKARSLNCQKIKEIDVNNYLLSPPDERSSYGPIIVKLKQQLSLPSHIRAYANPKSSAGRIDLKVRTIFDKWNKFDQSPLGYEGNVWMILEAGQFPVITKEDISVMQLRFYADKRETSQLNDDWLEHTAANYPLLYDLNGDRLNSREMKKYIDEGLTMGIDLSQDIVSYVAKFSEEPIDLSAKGACDPKKYFEPIYKKELKDDTLTIRPSFLYLFSGSHLIGVPPDFCAEMQPFKSEFGDLRSHYAGYFDPGFGYGTDGSIKGASIVHELRSMEQLNLRHGDYLSTFKFYKMRHPPKNIYGINSNYQAQKGIKLAKYFKPWA